VLDQLARTLWEARISVCWFLVSERFQLDPQIVAAVKNYMGDKNNPAHRDALKETAQATCKFLMHREGGDAFVTYRHLDEMLTLAKAEEFAK
jgi:hypothetical protein